jgi:hypothetical protein
MGKIAEENLAHQQRFPGDLKAGASRPGRFLLVQGPGKITVVTGEEGQFEGTAAHIRAGKQKSTEALVVQSAQP